MTPRELVRELAPAFGAPEKRLIPLDRAAAEEGLRASTGGRGGVPPEMTSADAAALSLMMLGHTGGISPKLTADRVRQLWRATGSLAPLATWNAAVSDEMNAKLAIESLRFVEDIKQTLSDFAEAKGGGCTFGECLAALIDDCISGRMRSFLDKHSGGDREKFNLKIEIPDLIATIEFANIFDERDMNGRPITLDVAYQFSGVVDHDRSREITTTQEMTVLPLLRIAEAFRN